MAGSGILQVNLTKCYEELQEGKKKLGYERKEGSYTWFNL